METDFPRSYPQTEGHKEECPKCMIVIDEWSCPLTPDGLCPRCGYDIRNTITIEDLSPSEKEKRKAFKEFHDLCLMLKNWSMGYVRVMDEQNDPDFSSPHDFMLEVGEQMAPYLARLDKMGYVTEELKSMIREAYFAAMDRIINKVHELEYLKRLTGEWSEKDQEIKDYWEEKTSLLGDTRVPQISQE